jgi:hypothetical protein
MGSRFDPLAEQINIVIDQTLSRQAQSAAFARFARQTLAEAEQVDAEVLGHVPTHETIVDGAIGASEDTVRPGGVIVYTFDLITDMFAWIEDQLIQNSPVGSGRDPHPGLYKRSHLFFADDVEADPLKPPAGIKVGTFVNAVPYARKIEAGESPQFPDGVYEAVAHTASRRFGNVARIVFDYRTAVGGAVLSGLKGNKSAGRNPAIIATVR